MRSRWSCCLLWLVVGCSAGPAGLDGGAGRDAAVVDAASPDAAPLPAACGDGNLDPGEACDGPQLGDLTCAGHGFTAGAIACTSTCTADLSGCAGRCGNGRLDPGEDCEPGQTIERTCEDEGWYPGELRCGSACTWDHGACGGRCGDDQVQEGEVCDGAAGPRDCAELGFFAGGALACRASCVREHACYAPRLAPADTEVRLGRFSPSGDRLFTFERDGEETLWRLVSRHIASGVVQTIAEREGGLWTPLDVSADGTRVVYRTPEDVSITLCTAQMFDFTTGRTHEIGRGVGCSGRGVAFSPDGEHVVVVGDQGQETGTLWLFDARDGTGVPLTRTLVAPGAHRRRWTFTPDGRQLLFFDQGSARAWAGTLHAHDLASGVTVEVDPAVFVDVRLDDPSLAFSADGRRLAYFRACVEGTCDLVERELTWGAPIEIAGGVHAASTVLSPSWTSAVVVRTSTGAVTISLLDRASSTLRPLPEGWAWGGVAVPVYSADGTQLVYPGRVAGGYDTGRLFHMDVRTGTVTPIARDVPGRYIDEPRFTADGRAVLFLRRVYPGGGSYGDVYLTTLGGATATVAVDATSAAFLGPAQHVVTMDDDERVAVFDRAAGSTVLTTHEGTWMWADIHPRWLVYESSPRGAGRGLYLYDLVGGGAPLRLGEDSVGWVVGSETHFALTRGLQAFLAEYPR